MFTDRIFTKPTALSAAIDALVSELSNEAPGSKEYTDLVDQLTKLYKLKEIDLKLVLQEAELLSKQEVAATEATQKENEHQLKAEIADVDRELKELEIENKRKEMKIPFGIKPETLAVIAANLLGIAVIVGHERLNVIATKAIGFVKKV
jgi:hypothetical protein